MISFIMMTKILWRNLENVFSNDKNGFKKDLAALPPRELFHVYIIIMFISYGFSRSICN